MSLHSEFLSLPKLEKPRNGLTQSFLYEDVLGEADKDITGKRGVDP